MHQLYDTGYQIAKDDDALVRAVRKLEGFLVDARMSPRSRNPQWRGGNLAKKLKTRYHHVPALGNVNYKGGAVQINNIEAGVERVLALLEQGPVVLMCACWNRPLCHRMAVIQHMKDEHGISCEYLDREKLDELAGPDPNKPHQPSLFGE